MTHKEAQHTTRAGAGAGAGMRRVLCICGMAQKHLIYLITCPLIYIFK